MKYRWHNRTNPLQVYRHLWSKGFVPLCCLCSKGCCYATCALRGINPRLMICHLRSKGFVLLRHLCSKGYVSLHHLCSKPSAVRPSLYFKLISVPHISWHDNLVHGSHCNGLGLLLGRPQTSLANLTMCMWIKDCAAQLLTGLNHEIKSHKTSWNTRKKYCHHAKT